MKALVIGLIAAFGIFAFAEAKLPDWCLSTSWPIQTPWHTISAEQVSELVSHCPDNRAQVFGHHWIMYIAEEAAHLGGNVRGPFELEGNTVSGRVIFSITCSQGEVLPKQDGYWYFGVADPHNPPYSMPISQSVQNAEAALWALRGDDSYAFSWTRPYDAQSYWDWMARTYCQ